MIDSDPDMARTDFVESVFRASELNGGLYRMFPNFFVNTVIGHPSVVGPREGWTMDEFRAVLDNNPQADFPMGNWLTKDNFFEQAITSGIDEYVDWAAGTVHFNTGSYAQLLEFANRFPAEIDWGDYSDWVSQEDLIAERRQLMAWSQLYDFSSIKWERDMFPGGDIVFKGFPADSGNGSSFTTSSSLAITSRSANKAGAWEFLRIFLSTEWQRANSYWGFPVNKEVFNEKAEEAMRANDWYGGFEPIPRPAGRRVVVTDDVAVDDDNSEDFDDDFDGDIDIDNDWGWDDDWYYRDRPLTQEEVDQIIHLINSITNFTNTNEALMNIIREDAADFFSGVRSAQDTASRTQSRASRLIAEQS